AVRGWAETPLPPWPDPLPEEHRRAWRAWIPPVLLGYFFARLWLLRGLLDTPGGQAGIFVDLVQYGLIWAATFAAVFTAGLSPGSPGRVDYRLVALCGVAAFLLHNTIDFSLFVPGTLTVFAGLGGVLLAGISKPANPAANLEPVDQATSEQGTAGVDRRLRIPPL